MVFKKSIFPVDVVTDVTLSRVECESYVSVFGCRVSLNRIFPLFALVTDSKTLHSLPHVVVMFSEMGGEAGVGKHSD